jgi:hypothetical protein
MEDLGIRSGVLRLGPGLGLGLGVTLFEITQTKAPVEEEVKVVEVAAQQPVDQPVASTSAPPKSRKQKTDNNVNTDEVVCGHRLNAII